MNKDSIDMNESIQDGLEKFLEQEMRGEKPPIKTYVEIPLKKTYEASYGYDEEEVDAEDDAEEYYEEYDYEEVRRPRKPIKQEPARRSTSNDRSKKSSSKKEKRQEKRKEKPVKNNRQDKKSKKREKQKKKNKAKRVLVILCIILVAILILWLNFVGKVYNKMTYERVETLAMEPMTQEGVTNILLIGNDSRENGDDGRSDAMILVSISKKTKTIHMTSLLRDMYVEIPGHDGNRLNAAYAYGGPELLCKTVEQNLGIAVDRYCVVNFQAFAALVDAVGGVDLELSNEEVGWVNAYLNEYNLLEGREMTTDYLDTSLSGMIHLNGPQALAYCRNRYIGTDFGRTERQRKVLGAVMKKVPLAMATNSEELIDGLFPNLTTNLTKTECYRLSFTGNKLLSYDMVQLVIPAEGTYQNANIRSMAVLQVDFDANKKLLRQEIYGESE